ncbi:MAG: hypothetical protein FGF52_02140 [Candidatus Brockarchaeota archaeon]|nr:hypothetical protein [Candidatus Brockarchaeota archaeon]
MRFFALVSGEHDELPYAEIEGAFEAESVPRNLLKPFTQVCRFEAPLEPVLRAFKRLAFSHFLCEEVCILGKDASTSEVISLVKKRFLKESVAFRVRRVRGSISPQEAVNLERKLNIEAKNAGLLVDLENPRNNIEVIASDGFLLVGRKICLSDRRRVFSRSGGVKPFFHPSSLKVELARVMLNLARVREGSIVLDPFSGTGTILIEANELRTIPLGLEIDPAMAYSSIRNYRWFGAFEVCQLLGDARHMPLRRVDAIVTDPPYGRRASTHGLESSRVYEGFIEESSRILRDEGWIVFLSPSKMPVEDFLASKGFKIMETYFIEVHTSLTRKLLVARNR